MPDIKTGHCVLQYLPQTYILNQKLLISLFTTIRLNKKAQLSFYVVGSQIAFFFRFVKTICTEAHAHYNCLWNKTWLCGVESMPVLSILHSHVSNASKYSTNSSTQFSLVLCQNMTCLLGWGRDIKEYKHAVFWMSRQPADEHSSGRDK